MNSTLNFKAKDLISINKPYISIIFRLLVVVLMIVGVYLSATSGGFMSSSLFLYFTIQSNLTIAFICAVFLVYDIIGLIKGKPVVIPKALYTLKFIFTVAIMLTFLVFWALLMPTMLSTPQYLYSASNLTTHTFVPIFALLDWFLYSREYKSKNIEAFWGVAMPLYYLIFSLSCSFGGIKFGGDAIVPYFFLDYVENTWFEIGNGKIGVFYWILIILVLVIALSFLLMWGKNKINQKFDSYSEKIKPRDEAINQNSN